MAIQKIQHKSTYRLFNYILVVSKMGLTFFPGHVDFNLSLLVKYYVMLYSPLNKQNYKLFN